MEKQANHIINEPVMLDAYIATLYLLDGQIGLIRGYEYADKPWRANYLVLVDWVHTYDTNYYEWETSVSYDWALVDASVDIYENEDVAVSESVSDEEITSEEAFAENESFDMFESEANEVAAEEDTDEEVASADDDSMGDALMTKARMLLTTAAVTMIAVVMKVEMTMEEMMAAMTVAETTEIKCVD
jgi:hypothetical protein